MNPLWQLTITRFREFYREPSAVFWVYGFPLILAFTLGLAFREKPVPPSIIDVQADSDDPAGKQLWEKLKNDSRLEVNIYDKETCKKRLRTSKCDLIILPRPGSQPEYEYILDETRSESVLARNAADGVLLRAFHPELPAIVETMVIEPGGRYIDFLIPGLLGINLL